MPVSVSAPCSLARLDEQLDGIAAFVAELDPSSCTGAQAASLVERFSRGEKLCAAARALCARRVAESGEFARRGHRDAPTWLAEVSGDSKQAAIEALQTAEGLDKLAGLEKAFRAGELSDRQAAEVARGATADPSAEGQLLDMARRGSLSRLKSLADEVEAAARSREEDEERHRRVHKERHLTTWLGRDGAFLGKFSLTPESGALFMGRIEQLAAELYGQASRSQVREPRAAYLADALVALATGGDAGAWPWPAFVVPSQPRPGDGTDQPRPGAGPKGSGAPGEPGPATTTRPGDPRDPGARTAQPGDPGVGPARPASPSAPRARTAQPGDPGVGPARPASPSAPRAGTAQPGAGPTASAATGDPGAGPTGPASPSATSDPAPVTTEPGGSSTACPPARAGRPDYTIIMRIDLEALVRGYLLAGEESSIDGTGHVPVSVVQRYLDVAKLKLVVRDGTDIASVFSFKRTIPVALQTALEHRDRTCVVPGCSATFGLQIDHIQEFAKGGPTSLANTCRLCFHHHSLKTNKGYTITGGPGNWRWLRPDGSVASPRPPAQPPAESPAPTPPRDHPPSPAPPAVPAAGVSQEQLTLLRT